MERLIVPLLKHLIKLYEGPGKPIIATSVVFGGRKIIININRRYAVASMFPDDLQETTDIEEVHSNIVLHFGKNSRRLCGITVSRISEFIVDWRRSGGVHSLLPILRRATALKK